MAKTNYIISVNNKEEFDKVVELSKFLGCETLLEFKEIPKVKTLFINRKHSDIQWSHRPINYYLDHKLSPSYKPIDLEKLEKRASSAAKKAELKN